MAHVVVLMGVSGSGKSTVGRLLAERLGCEFLEGDDLHAARSIEKMRRGEQLTDDDRAPWLAAIAVWIRDRSQRDVAGVVACSALTRAYRELLAEGSDPAHLVFVHLVVPPVELQRRVATRQHFMSPALLGTQLRLLEQPASDEGAISIAAVGSPDDVAAEIQRLVA